MWYKIFKIINGIYYVLSKPNKFDERYLVFYILYWLSLVVSIFKVRFLFKIFISK